MSLQIFPEARAALSIGKVVVLAVLVLIAVAVVGGWMADPFGWRKGAAQRWRGKAETAAAEGQVSQAQADAGAEALAAMAAAAGRDRQTIVIREENRHAILSAPGADAPVPYELARAFSDGLCRYDAYKADPGCAGLLGLPGPAAADHPGGATPER